MALGGGNGANGSQARKIKGFTFEKTHLKIDFDRNDEAMVAKIHKLIAKRIAVTEKNIRLNEE